MTTRGELGRMDHEPITRLLDMALEFADCTHNEAAYYVLVAAGHLAFTDRLKWQVINTAYFLGTNEYFTEVLDMGGVDKYPRDFIALADSLAREEVQIRSLVDEIDTTPEDKIVYPALDSLPDDDREQPAREARRNAAMQEAIVYRNRRARDDA